MWFYLMTIIFVVLKVAGVLLVSWWLVFLPALFMLLVTVLILLLGIAVGLLTRQG